MSDSMVSRMGKQMQWSVAAILSFAYAIVASAAPAVAQTTAPAPLSTGKSGLPLPRYVSLKAQPVNMRKGPGLQYPTAWVLRRAGMPLEIVREYEGWREVRDAEGTTGWVLGSLLSGRRTAAAQAPDRSSPAAERSLISLHSSESASSRLVAQLESGTIVDVDACDGRWCQVKVFDFTGYIEQRTLWGVYPSEVID